MTRPAVHLGMRTRQRPIRLRMIERHGCPRLLIVTIRAIAALSRRPISRGHRLLVHIVVASGAGEVIEPEAPALLSLGLVADKTRRGQVRPFEWELRFHVLSRAVVSDRERLLNRMASVTIARNKFAFVVIVVAIRAAREGHRFRDAAFVAGLAIDSGVKTFERKSRQIVVEPVRGFELLPGFFGVAIGAPYAKSAVVVVFVAVSAVGVGEIRERREFNAPPNRRLVTLRAVHRAVGAAQRKIALRVIEQLCAFEGLLRVAIRAGGAEGALVDVVVAADAIGLEAEERCLPFSQTRVHNPLRPVTLRTVCPAVGALEGPPCLGGVIERDCVEAHQLKVSAVVLAVAINAFLLRDGRHGVKSATRVDSIGQDVVAFEAAGFGDFGPDLMTSRAIAQPLEVHVRRRQVARRKLARSQAAPDQPAGQHQHPMHLP